MNKCGSGARREELKPKWKLKIGGMHNAQHRLLLRHVEATGIATLLLATPCMCAPLRCSRVPIEQHSNEAQTIRQSYNLQSAGRAPCLPEQPGSKAFPLERGHPRFRLWAMWNKQNT